MIVVESDKKSSQDHIKITNNNKHFIIRNNSYRFIHETSHLTLVSNVKVTYVTCNLLRFVTRYAVLLNRCCTPAFIINYNYCQLYKI